MRENERKAMLEIADLIKAEVDRLCMSNNIFEVIDMCSYARANIERLYLLRHEDLREGEKE